MRVLLVSDLHYSLKQFDWVVGVASDYDLVMLGGDQLDIRSYVAPDTQIAVVLEYVSRIAAKTAVAVCSGNHDLNARNELDEQAAEWLRAARDGRRVHRWHQRRHRRRVSHGVPVVGRSASREAFDRHACRRVGARG